MRKSEILNTLEKMVEDLYEVGNPDAQYYEQIVGEAMDIVMAVSYTHLRAHET